MLRAASGSFTASVLGAVSQETGLPGLLHTLAELWQCRVNSTAEKNNQSKAKK